MPKKLKKPKHTPKPKTQLDRIEAAVALTLKEVRGKPAGGLTPQQQKDLDAAVQDLQAITQNLNNADKE